MKKIKLADVIEQLKELAESKIIPNGMVGVFSIAGVGGVRRPVLVHDGAGHSKTTAKLDIMVNPMGIVWRMVAGSLNDYGVPTGMGQ